MISMDLLKYGIKFNTPSWFKHTHTINWVNWGTKRHFFSMIEGIYNLKEKNMIVFNTALEVLHNIISQEIKIKVIRRAQTSSYKISYGDVIEQYCIVYLKVAKGDLTFSHQKKEKKEIVIMWGDEGIN